MRDLHTVAGVVTETRDDGAPGFTARLVPWGEVAHVAGVGQERFMPGSMRIPDSVVPLSIDHGNGALELIGKLIGTENRTDGLYGHFDISATPEGLKTYTLLRDGVLSSVSAGFTGAKSTRDPQGARVIHSAELDHVAVVQKGAYPGARVVSVRSKEGRMADQTDTANQATNDEQADQPAAAAAVEVREAAPPADVVTRDQYQATEDRVRSLEALVETLQSGTQQSKPRVSLGRAAELVILEQRNKLTPAEHGELVELRALALDTTTTAAGLVPDFYSSEVISIVDTQRPFVSALDSDPIGASGMNLVYPEVVQKPTVAKQSAEHGEPSSTIFDIDPKTVGIDTFAGANDVAVQVIDRSTPSFLDAYYRELAGIYAQETEQEAETVVLGATGILTSVLADFGASASATISALTSAAVNIAKNVKRMPTHLWMSPDRWGQLAELADSTGRPLFVWGDNGPQNAIGQTNLASMAGQVAGLQLRMVPNFGTNTALLGWSGAAATAEEDPLRVQALQVNTLSWELGVYGYFATVVKHAKGFHSFTIV